MDRRLLGRGRSEARRVGRWLAARGGAFGLLASSPARRALETAELVARATGYGREIEPWQCLYSADLDATLLALRGVDERFDGVLLVTHNPHAEHLVSHLAAAGRLALRMSPAALAILAVDAERWDLLPEASVRLHALVAPELL